MNFQMIYLLLKEHKSLLQVAYFRFLTKINDLFLGTKGSTEGT